MRSISVKPRCIVFTRIPAPSEHLLCVSKILSGSRNVVCISFIRDSGEQDDDFGYDDVRMSQQCMEFIQLTGYATQFKYQKISSLHSVASALTCCCGLGLFHTNTVLIDFPTESALDGSPESLLYHYHMHRVCLQQCNLVVVKGCFTIIKKSSIIRDYTESKTQKEPTVEKVRHWKKMRRLLGISSDISIQSEVDDVCLQRESHKLSSQLRATRMELIAEQKVRARRMNDEILRRSSKADLVLINIPKPPGHVEKFWRYINLINDMTKNLNHVLFARGIDRYPTTDESLDI